MRVGPQAAAKRLVELPRVKGLRRAVVEHVHHVDDHHVVAAVVLLDELPPVAVDHPHAAVLEGPAVPVEQVLAAKLHHLAVDDRPS